MADGIEPMTEQNVEATQPEPVEAVSEEPKIEITSQNNVTDNTEVTQHGT